MTLDNFLSFLQQIITMTDPNDRAAVALAKNALNSVLALGQCSGMTDAFTLRLMMRAENLLTQLLYHRDEFAGKPGDYAGNQNRRHRLRNVLTPGC